MPHKRVHASCVAIGGKGILLLGKSGSGKSDLALRLIEAGARLVADDQVELSAQKKIVCASAPKKLAGLIEARGLGLLQLPFVPRAKLALAVMLVASADVERMPEPRFWGCLGARVPLLSLHAFDASTPVKIRLWLKFPRR